MARSKEERQVVRPEQSAPVFERARRLAVALFDAEVTAEVVLWNEGYESNGPDPLGVLRIDPRDLAELAENRELLWVADTAQHAKVRDLIEIHGANGVVSAAPTETRMALR